MCTVTQTIGTNIQTIRLPVSYLETYMYLQVGRYTASRHEKTCVAHIEERESMITGQQQVSIQ